MQLNNGKLDGKQIIPASAIAQTWLPHSILGNGGTMFNNGHFSLYGLGWFLEEYSGKKIVSHTGGVNGFVTSVTLGPGRKTGHHCIYQYRCQWFLRSAEAGDQDAYLGLPYRNYHKVAMGMQKNNEARQKKEWDLKKDTVDTKPAAALPLDAYAGVYRHSVYGLMYIKAQEGKLVATFEHHHGRFAELGASWRQPFFCGLQRPAVRKKSMAVQHRKG